ncbi:hypothetical protein BT96DRAFT_669758 [Gymnopus androsaceus JB14]|uniref:Uncharacterized protein n=1 Tax=Gymnopus androsaceus JB14 TaxID=1447944 RepID=A0A6A4IJL9_9AGAR|nr:hypothetical protein BT96DRAFT_669758 [Gymnopus androsaceus JB14]
MSFLRTRISDIENQVQSIDHQISQLIQLKDAKTAEIALLRNIFSPIRRLPLETLSEIFEHVCLDSWPSQKETHHSMLPIGALFSHVSFPGYVALGGNVPMLHLESGHEFLFRIVLTNPCRQCGLSG